MPDYGARVADQAIAETARQLRKVYRQAAKDLREKLAEFTARHLAKDAEKRALLEAGKITKAEYESWLRGQVFIRKQWKEKIEQASRIMDNANQAAAKIVRANKFGVFAENYNYAAYELEKLAHGSLGFNLFSSDSVARLLTQDPKMLPEWKIDQKKDYAWNRKKVEGAINQGIIQGEGIREITDRLVDNLCTQNENKMRTFARTGITGAQNAGRIQQMHDAEELGIKVKKRWVATLDNRTRDTHADLDGQTIPVDEPFEVTDDDGMHYEIMYPGDPMADACMVYNCRCTMIQIYEGIDRTSVRRAYEDEDDSGHRKSYLVENMTYREWQKWKKGQR